MRVAVCVWWLTIPSQCESGSDIFVRLFANDQLKRDKCCGFFNLIGFDYFKGFVGDEHFLVFFVDGGIAFVGVQDMECSV